MISNLLSQKAPKPVAPHSDPILFSKDGRLREQFHELCLGIGLDPLELEVRKLDSFKEKDLSYSAQVLRYNHFENKRQAKIEALKTLAREKYPNLFTKKPVPQPLKEPETPVRRKSGTLTTLDQRRGSQNAANMLSKTKNQHSQESSLDVSAIQDKDKLRLITNGSIQPRDRDDALSDRSDSSLLSLNNSFRNLMMKKTIEKQRQFDALKKAEDFQQEQNNSFRQKIRNKEERFFRSMDKNKTSFQKMLKEKAQTNNEKKEFIRTLQKEEAKSRKTKEKKINDLMQRGLSVASESRNSRLNSLMEREAHWQERRIHIEETEERGRTIDVDDKLFNFQNKMNKSMDLHYNQLGMRVASLAQHNQDVSAKYRNAREQEELDKRLKMATILNKMTKAEASIRKTKMALSSIQSESVNQKLQEANQRKKQVDRDRFKTLNTRVIKKHEMKDKFWSDKKGEIQEQLQAKREASTLRMEDVQENLMIYSAAKARENERKLKNYLDRTRVFNEFKNNAKKELHELDQSFRRYGRPNGFTPRSKTPSIPVNTNMTIS